MKHEQPESKALTGADTGPAAGAAGWIAPMGLNDAMLDIIRRFDAQFFRSESDEARLTGISRPHVHNLHHDPVVLTIPLVARWCNGARVLLPNFVNMGLERLDLAMARLKAAGREM